MTAETSTINQLMELFLQSRNKGEVSKFPWNAESKHPKTTKIFIAKNLSYTYSKNTILNILLNNTYNQIQLTTFKYQIQKHFITILNIQNNISKLTFNKKNQHN